MDIEERIRTIEERNRKVELDKEWEKSWVRSVILALLTYAAISTYMWAVGIERPWIQAIIPSTAFMISTLTMPFFKWIWLKYLKRA